MLAMIASIASIIAAFATVIAAVITVKLMAASAYRDSNATKIGLSRNVEREDQ